MSEITRLPTRLSSWAAGGCAVVALVTSGFYSWWALALGTIGLGFVSLGVGFGVTAGVTAGAFGLLIAALAAGVQGAPATWVMLSVLGTVLAWDIGGTAVSLGEQLGREAETRRLELVHLAGSVLVGVVTVGVGFGLYQLATGRQPVGALVFLLVAAVLLVVALE